MSARQPSTRLSSSLALSICLLALCSSAVRAQPTAPEMEARLVTNVRQLTFEGLRAGEGYYGADGSKIVFQSEREPGNPFYQIYVMDLEFGDVQRVSPGTGKTTCAWIHPNGRDVLFASTHGDPESVELQEAELAFRKSGKARRYAWDYDEHFDIWVRNTESGSLRRLTDARGYDAEGSFSPDGKLVAFSSNRHAYTDPNLSEADRERLAADPSLFLDLYIMNSDGSNLRRLTTHRGYDGGPFFSPDGRRLCFRRFAENGLTAEIYTIGIDGKDERQLTSIGAMSWAPFFHPSSEYLIFTTNRHGFTNFELYLVDPEGACDPVRVTFTGGFDGLPTFTPDGKTLAWTSTRTKNGRSQIFRADWDHEAALALLDAARRKPVAKDPYDLGATAPAIAVDDLKGYVGFLAAERMGGRMTGSAGEAVATDAIAHWFERIGLEPAGEDGGYFQPFPFRVAGERGEADLEGFGRNVLGVLKAEGSTLPPLVLGAHVDHLGRSPGSRSKAEGDARRRLHPGADDNASGVAALLEVAEYLVSLRSRGKLPLVRDIVFAAWSGEELGLIGSKHCVSSWAGDDGKLTGEVAAYLNLDMVGRLGERPLTLSGIGSSGTWRREIERRNVSVGLPLSLVDACALSTDSTAFFLAGVPILSVSSGEHEDYHRPTDTVERLDFDGLERTARFVSLLARGLAISRTAPGFVAYEGEVEKSDRTSGSAYLGTIPDYAKPPIPGLKITGTVPKGPAEAAGLKGGDIIVELDGRAIADVYGYKDAIEALVPGKKTTVVVVRGGKRLTLAVTPGARH